MLSTVGTFVDFNMKSVITGAIFIIGLSGRSLSRSISDNSIDTEQETWFLQLPTSEPEEKYFEQKLDHFNRSDNTKWNQKYYREQKYYLTGGPVYLKLADKGPINRNSFDNGYWHSHGKEKNAMFFYMSHRFYELKMPVNSAETKNLVYLNASQAIEDCIEFIKGMNQEHNFPKNTKWIVFGTSYSGNLAAWLRTLYPDLIHGAVASSAPVLARMDFQEYLDMVGSTLANYRRKCRKDIALANQDLDMMVESAKGRKDLEEIFSVCEPLDGHRLNVSFFAKNMVDYISNAVLYDFEQEKVKRICDKMLENSDTKTPIHRYSAVMNMLLEDNKEECLPTNFHTYLQFLKSTHPRFALYSGRLWLYQRCHQFGWFQTSRRNFRTRTFSKNVNLSYHVNLCSRTFDSGLRITRQFINNSVVKTNELFGGLTLNTSRTLLIHGDADPGKSAQITSNKGNQNLEILTIKGGSHCSDIHYEDTNKQEIENTIRQIKDRLNTWLEK